MMPGCQHDAWMMPLVWHHATHAIRVPLCYTQWRHTGNQGQVHSMMMHSTYQGQVIDDDAFDLSIKDK